MRAFDYMRPQDQAEAVALATEPGAAFIAGGTTQLDLMKDGVLQPVTLVDLTRLPLRGVTRDGDLLDIGALTTMEELAAATEDLPVVRQALLASASTQLRNMATIGGNLLQRTRCRYFRDVGVPDCNKRTPGSGCAARTGPARTHAILGVSEHCIALHASDLAVALTALDATVRTSARELPLQELYLWPGDTPDRENVLARGELITSIQVRLPPPGTRSGYLKVRDRASYEFALTSAAALVTPEGQVRLAVGGVGTVPWRVPAAEELLSGAPPSRELFERAAQAVLEGAVTVPGTAFKVELAKRTIVRILETLT